MWSLISDVALRQVQYVRAGFLLPPQVQDAGLRASKDPQTQTSPAPGLSEMHRQKVQVLQAVRVLPDPDAISESKQMVFGWPCVSSGIERCFRVVAAGRTL